MFQEAERTYRAAAEDLVQAIRDKLQPTGALPRTTTPAEFGQFMRAEEKKWVPVIKRANIKPQ